MDDTLQSDYLIAPRTSFIDFRFVGIAAGVVVVAVALFVVAVKRLRPW